MLRILSREEWLVLRAGSAAAPADFDDAPTVDTVEWHRLLMLADRERAALPLWREIRDSSVAGDAAAAVLKEMARVWEFKLLHLERLLIDALGGLKDAGIDVMLLKGAAAVASVYGSFSARPMLDVDLLVAEDRAEDAWEIARGLGWRWDEARYPKRAYGAAHHLPPLYDAFGASCGLEIHTRLWMPDHPFWFTEAMMWDSAVRVEFGGGGCVVPSINHQLLHCCIHFAWSHRMRSHGWRAFSDIGAFVRSGEIDWDEFVRLARSSRADTCCYWPLRLAAAVTDVTIPAGTLVSLRPVGPTYLLNALERHFLMNLLPGAGGSPSLLVDQRLWRLGIQRGAGSGGIDLPDAPRPVGLGAKVAHHSMRLASWVNYFRKLA